MYLRVLRHLLFWLSVALLYTAIKMLFPAPSEMEYGTTLRFLRALVTELIFLPWKAIPFYLVIYGLLPRFLPRAKYAPLLVGTLLVLLVSTLGYRSMIRPVSAMLYGETPEFSVFSLRRILFSLSEIVPVSALAAAVKLLGDRAETQRRVSRLQREKRQAELHFLRAQTNPHFLFNTLNNLYGIARKEAGNTAPYLLKLSHLMRYILREGSQPTVPLATEFKVIEDYVQLERLRFDERLRVSLDAKVDDWNQAIAPLILLPFVENAFKHGAAETRFTPRIDLRLVLTGGELDFFLRNTYEAANADFSAGTGLNNVRRQLDLIYPDAHQLRIEPGADTFSVHLQIRVARG